MAFTADWLALREAADRAARDPVLAAAATATAGLAPVIMDLGCGTGSTRRALMDGMPQDSRWRLVDNDPFLLGLATGPGVDTITADLTRLDSLPWDGVTLVTCSALLDLVSTEWLDHLVTILAARRLPLYAALSYDGRMDWDPSDPGDYGVREAFNRHQRGDKGFGPALGPTATSFASDLLRARGFAVQTADSPWRLPPGAAALQDALLSGIASAARDAGADAVEDWQARRHRGLSGTTMVVGHLDLLAHPPG